MLWDLVKFYECLKFGRLVSEAAILGFPLALLRLNIAAYQFPRHVSLCGMIAEGVIPFGGVVAGCGAATTHVNIYDLRPLD